MSAHFANGMLCTARCTGSPAKALPTETLSDAGEDQWTESCNGLPLPDTLSPSKTLHLA